MIAEKKGVQRHIFYSHFPDERSMLMACSGHVMERDPLPDAEHHELVREINMLRMAPAIAAYHEVLGAKLTLALSFHTWRTLTCEAGPNQKDAVAAMVG